MDRRSQGQIIVKRSMYNNCAGADLPKLLLYCEVFWKPLNTTVIPNRLLRLSYLFSAEIKQAKIVDFVDRFREIICDRLLKHIKSFENICC